MLECGEDFLAKFTVLSTLAWKNNCPTILGDFNGEDDVSENAALLITKSLRGESTANPILL